MSLYQKGWEGKPLLTPQLKLFETLLLDSTGAKPITDLDSKLQFLQFFYQLPC